MNLKASVCDKNNYENQYLFMLAMAFFFVFAWSSMPQIVPDILLFLK